MSLPVTRAHSSPAALERRLDILDRRIERVRRMIAAATDSPGRMA